MRKEKRTTTQPHKAPRTCPRAAHHVKGLERGPGDAAWGVVGAKGWAPADVAAQWSSHTTTCHERGAHETAKTHTRRTRNSVQAGPARNGETAGETGNDGVLHSGTRSGHTASAPTHRPSPAASKTRLGAEVCSSQGDEHARDRRRRHGLVERANRSLRTTSFARERELIGPLRMRHPLPSGRGGINSCMRLPSKGWRGIWLGNTTPGGRASLTERLERLADGIARVARSTREKIADRGLRAATLFRDLWLAQASRLNGGNEVGPVHRPPSYRYSDFFESGMPIFQSASL